MTKGKRIALIIFALSAFLFITPAALFYSLGYRYNFETNTISEVGMIIVQFLDPNARVYLNGAEVGTSSPLKLRGLAPNTYHVEIRRDGYVPWVKDLPVQSKLIAWTPVVKLFPSQPARTNLLARVATTHPFSLIETTSNGKRAVLVSEKDRVVTLFDIERMTSSETLISESEFASYHFESATWSPDDERILFSLRSASEGTSPEFVIFNTSTQTFSWISKTFSVRPSSLVWNQKQLLFGIVNGNLHSFDIDKGNLSRSYDSGVRGFAVVGSTSEVYYASVAQQNMTFATLKSIRFDGSHTQLISTSIPVSTSYQLFVQDSSHIAFSTHEHALYTLLPNKASRLLTDTFVDTHWLYNLQTQKDPLLVYAAGHEVNVYNVTTDDFNTITRTSATITDLIPHSSLRYVFLQTDQDLYALDLTPELPRYSARLIQASPRMRVLYSSASNLIYTERDSDESPLLLYELAL